MCISLKLVNHFNHDLTEPLVRGVQDFKALLNLESGDAVLKFNLLELMELSDGPSEEGRFDGLSHHFWRQDTKFKSFEFKITNLRFKNQLNSEIQF